MPEGGEQQTEPARDRITQVDHRVCGDPCQQRAASFAAEEQAAKRGRGQRAKRAVPGDPQRRAGHGKRGEQRVDEAEPVARSGAHAVPPGGRVSGGTEAGRGLRDVPVQQHGVLAVQRVRHLHGRERPFHRQAEAPERRGREHHRQHGRAHVVSEPVQGERRAAQPAAELVRAFEQQHLEPGVGQRDRADQAVGPGPHHYRVKPVRRSQRPSSLGCAAALHAVDSPCRKRTALTPGREQPPPLVNRTARRFPVQ